MKALVAYFSISGITAGTAKSIAEAVNGDLFEIVPEKPYTRGDVNWMNPISRCNREMMGKKDVPVSGRVGNMEDYVIIFVGFPIWYGCAPNVVNTFLKGYDLSGKKIAVFATSGGSGIGKTAEKLAPYVSGAEILDAKVFKTAGDAAKWAADLI
ncbi:MAG: flavodoxin [Oscillospiraceae bacterium]|nr:flavodoxin [Oscillospiraceae bacterium]